MLWESDRQNVRTHTTDLRDPKGIELQFPTKMNILGWCWNLIMRSFTAHNMLKLWWKAEKERLWWMPKNFKAIQISIVLNAKYAVRMKNIENNWHLNKSVDYLRSCSCQLIDHHANTVIIFRFYFTHSAAILRTDRHERANPNMLLQLHFVKCKKKLN